MSAFVFQPRADALAALNTSALTGSMSILDALRAAPGSIIVGNDLVFATLSDFGLLPGVTKAAAAPAAPHENQLWYDTVNHTLRYYDVDTATWPVVTAAAMRNILGIGVIGYIGTSRTYNVPGDFATPYDAETYLRNYIIDPDVTVTVNVAAGTYNHTKAMRGHPQGDRIFYVSAGYNVGAPDSALFTVTGGDAASRAANNATNLAVLQGRYKTTISCALGGIALLGGCTINMVDFLFIGSAGNTAVAADSGRLAIVGGCSFAGFNLGFFAYRGGMISGTGTSVLISMTADAISATQCGGVSITTLLAFSSSATGANVALGGFVSTTSLSTKGCATIGILSAHGGSVYASSSLSSRFNANDNIRCFDGASVAVGTAGTSTISNSGANGVSCYGGGSVTVDNSSIYGNVLDGIKATGGANVSAVNASITGNSGNGAQAGYGGTIILTGATLTGNGARGVLSNGGYVDASNTTCNGNVSPDYGAYNGGYIIALGYTTVPAPAFSPAINTVGNSNAYIRG